MRDIQLRPLNVLMIISGKWPTNTTPHQQQTHYYIKNGFNEDFSVSIKSFVKYLIMIAITY